MDGTRFDTIARALRDTRSRRRAVAAVFAGTLGLLGWSEAREAGAKNLKCKQIKDK